MSSAADESVSGTKEDEGFCFLLLGAGGAGGGVTLPVTDPGLFLVKIDGEALGVGA